MSKIMMITQKRFSRDKATEKIYNQLWRNGNPEGIFFDLKDIFLFAAILGYKFNRRVPLSAKDPLGQNVLNEYLPTLLGISFAKTKNPLYLLGGTTEEETREIQKIIEEYANGGVYELKERVLDLKGKPYDNYIKLVDFLQNDAKIDNPITNLLG